MANSGSVEPSVRAREPAEEFAGTPRFRLLRRLGEGGSGIVYEAHDNELGVSVALKTLHSFSADGLLRFKNEFRVLHDLEHAEHPSVVRLGELFEHHGVWFFTMELVDGVDLFAYVRHVRVGGVDDLHDHGDGPTPPTMPVDPNAPVRARPPPRILASWPRHVVAPTVPGAGAPFDEGRLRAVLPKLVRALAALHGARKVHRDVKPSNVLVTRDGLVKLLDFGLVVELDRATESATPEARATAREIVGTAPYMAPEQAAGDPVGPAADWYSVGAILRRVMTLPNGELSRDAPADLVALSDSLLRRDAAARPTADDLLRLLDGSERSASGRRASSLAPFVGRHRELAALRAAFARTQLRDGAAVVVTVEGESGIGKSALARELGVVLAREHGARVLAGRCYERESVPYKAVDGLIDALSHELAAMDDAVVSTLLPRDSAHLARVFPVLRRVPAFARAADEAKVAARALDRADVFAALRDLFTRLAGLAPLVLVIDDLHWSDGDSLALLRDLLRPSDARPSPLLFVATARGAWEPLVDVGAVTLTLGALDAGPASELARHLARADDRVDADESLARSHANALARDADGHPLFIELLVRHAQSPTTALARGRQTVDDALRARVASLEPNARQILELVAIAFSRVSLDVVARAASLDPSELAHRIATLRTANLVRSVGSKPVEVEPYHDRIRAAVVGALDPKAREAWHLRLALALEEAGGTEADPEALAMHFREAGKNAEAARYAAISASRAGGALAFDRAAMFYAMVFELGAPAVEEARMLRSRLADALAQSGRSADAAPLFLKIAEEESPALALDLRRRAAEQFLMSGNLDDGVDVLRTVLESAGMRLPETQNEALASLVVRRVQLAIRGLAFDVKPSSAITDETRRRIDACFTAAKCLGMIDTIRGNDFQTRHLLLALSAGDPMRVSRALCLEVGYQASRGSVNRQKTRELLALARDLARRHGDAHATRYADGVGGIAEFLMGEWRLARDVLARTVARAPRQSGFTYETNAAHRYWCSALYFLGDLKELSARLPHFRSECRERGDVHLSTHLRMGIYPVVELARGDVDGARRNLADAIREGASQKAPFREQGGGARSSLDLRHFLALYASVQIDLFAGDTASAYGAVRTQQRPLAAAHLFRVQYLRVNMLDIEARTALALATDGAAHLDVVQRWELLSEADAAARALDREGVPWAHALASLVQCGTAAARGDGQGARFSAARAVSRFDALGMRFHAAVARRRLAALSAGADVARLAREADAYFEGEGTNEARRLEALLAPAPAPTATRARPLSVARG